MDNLTWGSLYNTTTSVLVGEEQSFSSVLLNSYVPGLYAAMEALLEDEGFTVIIVHGPKFVVGYHSYDRARLEGVIADLL